MSLQRIRNSKGFTIIELLIVIVVIGILAALVLTAYGNIQQRARNAERQNDINEIHKQAELYYSDSEKGGGSYPASMAQLGLSGEVIEDPRNVAIGATGAEYTFTPLPSGCTGLPAAKCTSYTLQAAMEGTPATFARNSLNNT